MKLLAGTFKLFLILQDNLKGTDSNLLLIRDGKRYSIGYTDGGVKLFFFSLRF